MAGRQTVNNAGSIRPFFQFVFYPARAKFNASSRASSSSTLRLAGQA